MSKIDLFSNDPIEVYNLLLSGKLKKFPNNYLDQEACKEIMRYVLLDTLKMSRQDICDNVNYVFLQQYKLGYFRKLFDCKIHQLVNYCFPEMEIYPWELKAVPNNFWKDENNRKEFLLWLAKKEGLDLTKRKDAAKITRDILYKYGGYKAAIYSGGIYPLICLVTGNSIKEWELEKMSVWTKEKAIEAIKWLIEEKLQWSYDEVYNNLTANVFRKYNLDGLLNCYCNHSPLKALQLAYPGKYTSLAHQNPFKK